MSLRHVIHGFLSIQLMRGYKVTRYVDASVRHATRSQNAPADGHGLSAPDALLAIPAPPVPRRKPLLVNLFFGVFATRNCQTSTPERSALSKGSSGFRVGHSRPNGPLRCLTEHGR